VLLRSFSDKELRVWLKLEYTNPGGSHKDRAAYYMIKQAFEKGLLRPGSRIVEVSSGNTAISLAWIGRRLGLEVYIVVDSRVSPTKVSLLKMLGAKVEIAPLVPPEHPLFKRNIAIAIAREKSAVFLDQDSNDANHLAHYESTCVEIVEQLGRVSAFVMGVGTGGTITGVGRCLKERMGSDVKIYGVVPKGSSLDPSVSTGRRSYIEGLVGSTKPELYNKYSKYVDELIPISEEEALAKLRVLMMNEGIAAGPSTGAAIAAIEKLKNLGKIRGDVVTIAADSIVRYPHILEKLVG